jgi:hypothetical protein
MSTPSESRDAPHARRSERGRTPWLVGIAASVGLHLVALLLYSGITFIPTVTVTPPARGASTLDGLQLIDVVVADEEEDEEEARDDEAVAEPEPAPEVQVGQEAASTEDPEGQTPLDAVAGDDREWIPAAERLRVAEVDPRFLTINPEGQYMGAEEILGLDLDIALAAVRDSLNAAQDRADDALDWTWTDADGKRWGISPGKIHLGDLTLPLPGWQQMGSSPWNREAEMERARRDAEIDRQAVTGLILQTWEERFRAMRERRDRARADQRGTPPDTTSFRR